MGPAVSFSVPDTIGAAFVGFSVSCGLFGALSMQVFVYFQRYYLDRPIYKFLVAFLWLLELLDQIFIGYSVYYYNILYYNRPEEIMLGNIVWTLILQIVLGCLVGTVVKCCFTMRVWRFSKENLYITGGIVLLIFAQLGLALVYCIRAFQLNKFMYAERLRVVASLALGAGLLTDGVIAAALCYFLKKLRTGFKKSDTLINSLTTYAISTGALTGAVGLCTMILYNARPNTFFYIASYFNLGKLYAISFLSTLNTRKVNRGRGTDDQDEPTRDHSLSQNAVWMNGTHNTSARPRSQEFTPTKSVEIGIRKEISIITDLESAALRYNNSSKSEAGVAY
ncbi:hypothetical protein CPB83DRAFT_910032 [Crepidotus variabilis]|uniref:DUF6534 domain-containing protein n=1 Tax=Crepidotus variabilis TaxID=179855 RepID=A0A9P6E846_9AGAR|nr:hypothetical protein CPB83DRAFT_910032 [Crepidotus variabilis]